MFKKILLGLALAILILLIVIALQPGEYRVTRTGTIAAPPAVVFEHVNDLHKWQAWSPWAKLDPNAKNTFEGPAAGTGAIFKWDGDSNVGQGTMTITESRPSELVRFRLDFLKPMAGSSDTEFTLKPEGANTLVTWTMSGKNNFVAKAVCLVMSMEKMIGGQFELGLASLNAVVQAPVPKP